MLPPLHQTTNWEERDKKAEHKKSKKKPSKKQAVFYSQHEYPGVGASYHSEQQKQIGRAPGTEQGLGAGSGTARLGAAAPVALRLTLSAHPSLVLLIQPVWNPFAISFCFSPCCLGSSWTKGAGKIRGIREKSHSGTDTRDARVRLGRTSFGKTPLQNQI